MLPELNSWRTGSRVLLWLTVTLPLVLSVLSKILIARSPPLALNEGLGHPQEFNLTLPTTYGVSDLDAGVFERVNTVLGVNADVQLMPDTTAIVLNWSRLTNVKNIASLLCHPTLDGIIAEVFIWNNSPKKISHKVGAVFFSIK
jgi:hypothetical protein